MSVCYLVVVFIVVFCYSSLDGSRLVLRLGLIIDDLEGIVSLRDRRLRF